MVRKTRFKLVATGQSDMRTPVIELGSKLKETR